MLTIEDAVAAQQRGDTVLARDAYLAILDREPKNADAWHLLGVLEAQAGRLERGEELIRVALSHRDDFAPAWGNLGIVILQRGGVQDSLEVFDKAIALDDRNPDFFNNKGNAYKALSSFSLALDCYDRAIALSGSFSPAYNNRGSVLAELSRHDEALACYEHALWLNPNYEDAWFNKGSLFLKMALCRAAGLCFDRVLSINPKNAAAHNNLGLALKEQKNFDLAYGAFAKAASLAPQSTEYLFNKGDAAYNWDRLDESIDIFRECDRREPNRPECADMLGNSLKKAARYGEALDVFERLLSRHPQFARGHYNRGCCLFDARRFLEAEESFRRAIDLNPDHADSHYNLGCSRKKRGRVREAISCYDEALRRDPTHPRARFNRSLDLLLLGDFDRGWVEYESRWDCVDTKLVRPTMPKPLWAGEQEIIDKRLFIYHEQGFGDSIQFCRYLELLKAKGAHVIFGVTPKLVPLLSTAKGIDQLVTDADPIPEFDFHAPLLSLPRLFGTTLEDIPSKPKYLSSDPYRVDHWRDRLGPTKKKRIGIAWSGHKIHLNDHNRSIPFETFSKGLPVDFEYISLQTEIRESDRHAVERFGIRHFGGELNDFADTAALCELVDLVVSIDTSVAHLNAALGKPTWVLLPYIPDFRWLLGRDDSPWYPTVRLFRQGEDWAWGPVLARVHQTMAKI